MSRGGAGRAVPVLRRILAGLFALSWFGFPGFGVIDLSVTWNRAWPQMLEAGWGLYMTLFVGVAFTAIAVRPASGRAATTQLYVAAAALIVSAIAAAEWLLILWGVLLAAETLIVGGLPWKGRTAARNTRAWHPLMVPAALSAVPWLAYATTMWDLNRQDLADSDITMGIDHYAVQGAYALAVLALVVVAAGWPDGRRLMGTCAGLSAVYLGVVSWAWHPTAASMNHAWSAACILWGVVVVVLAWFDPLFPRPRTAAAD